MTKKVSTKKEHKRNSTIKLTTNEFIKKAKEVHGDKYDYSMIDYKNNKTKVKIICKIHGIFEQFPYDHLLGKNCRLCANESAKLGIFKFIEKAKEIHSNKYDYSMVNYKYNNIKIKIICPIHGIFEQTPNSHLSGHGCPKCNGKLIITNEQFIEKSKKFHGDKYDYSLVDYKNKISKIKIICPIHGEFEQYPHSHLNGHGCSSCTNNKKFKENDFINDCKTIHNNFYEYSLTIYKNMNSKIIIICPIHGEFEQTARKHKDGRGCRMCNKSHGERIIENFLIKYNINYISQKTFEECKYKQPLFFDFYLPDYRICIEYDGEQHFNKYRWEDNDEKLNIRINRDKIKDEYCIKNNIHLFRIKYTDDIEKEFLKISTSWLSH